MDSKPLSVLVTGSSGFIGTQQEISHAEAPKDGASIDQIMTKLDLDKLDPIVLLGSKIIVVKPDASRQELCRPHYPRSRTPWQGYKW